MYCDHRSDYGVRLGPLLSVDLITVVIMASALDHSSWILDETTVSRSHRKTTVREFCMNRSCGSGTRPQFAVRASPVLGPRLWILVETTVRESQRVGVGIEKLTREWEWEGVGLPIVASVTLRYVIADIIARLWVAALDSRSECH